MTPQIQLNETRPYLTGTSATIRIPPIPTTHGSRTRRQI